MARRMNEQGPRPLVDHEELSMLVRVIGLALAIVFGGFVLGVGAGLAVDGFRLMTGA